MGRRFLGIDYGTKRIGLSVSDPTGAIASPFKTLPAARTFDEQVRDVIDGAGEFDIDEWVVGLPLNMDGSAGAQAKVVEQFARRLAKASGAPVRLWDERLSSYEADLRMARSGLTHKKKKRRRDALAAQVILQSYLDAHTDPDVNRVSLPQPD